MNESGGRPERRLLERGSCAESDRREAEVLAEVIALVMYEDPPSLWAFPDDKRRREILPSFMRVFVDASLQQDEAYTVDDLSAACLWFPPGWALTEEEAAPFKGAIRAAAGEYAESGRLTIVG